MDAAGGPGIRFLQSEVCLLSLRENDFPSENIFLELFGTPAPAGALGKLQIPGTRAAVFWIKAWGFSR
jgi:hypothetical protein